jgi:hypothetical protein
MPPSLILPQCLGKVFDHLHAATVPVVLRAIDALSAGGWLTLTEIARHWPGATHVAAPLKVADRLLRSAPLSRHREALYRAMAHWLIRHERPVIVVDWSDLRADGSFKLLRAGLACRGRTITLWEEVHPEKVALSTPVEETFIRNVAALLPAHCRPIVITDAGFRRPWFRALLEQGWDYVGRLRTNARMQPQQADPTDKTQWVTCSDLHTWVRPSCSRDLGLFRFCRTQSMSVRVVLHAARIKGRHATTAHGVRRTDTESNDASRAAREPWVLVTSLTRQAASAAKIIALYARRMTIEESFRDLKSGAFGAGFEHSLSYKHHRIANLLVLFALAQFAAWLVGGCQEQHGQGQRLELQAKPQRRHYSTLRLGVEVLKRQAWWPPQTQLHSFLRHVAKGPLSWLEHEPIT